MVKLTAIDGRLYWGDWTNNPTEPEAQRGIIIYRYSSGDCDTIPWPMNGEARYHLRKALYDMRECGMVDGNVVLLPDDSFFTF